MIRFVTGLFSSSFPLVVVYMLQATGYDRKAYAAWLRRTTDFRLVMQRRMLEDTKVARLFLLFLCLGIGLQLVGGVVLLALSFSEPNLLLGLVGLIGIVWAPLTWAFLVMIPLELARKFYIIPQQVKLRQATKSLLAEHKGTIIAVAGSYGKTTMKELLLTVLSEGKMVAATPANKNVAASHYKFVKGLSGKEDIVIIEFGEGKPGDVAQFTDTFSPNIGIITGLAPAHLDQYGTLKAAGTDIFSLAEFVESGSAYVNRESDASKVFLQERYVMYGEEGIDDWITKNVKVTTEGTSFDLHGHGKELRIHSKLLGEHLVGTMVAVAVIGIRLGLSEEQVRVGLSKAVAYDHRMQPYRLGGAWIIDDAYNGNIEGVRAGTRLLAQLDAKRKVYVTPGLVDQGDETARIHEQMGRLIAGAKPDIVVLMQNSVTAHIMAGLKAHDYEGEVMLQADPLRFYTSLDQFVAKGDIVLLQNDWTDNYQ